MRVPSTRQSHPRSSGLPTQPSASRSPGGSTGAQGTPGGKARKPGVSGRRMILGQEVYLWVLVLIEVALIGGFRKFFRRYHGG